jgi:hypothetical protein
MGNPSERGLQHQPKARMLIRPAETWRKKAWSTRMDQILNSSGVEGSRVPEEVETQVTKSWAG